jgi:imidazolonepropionase-like amidohydrolase
MAGGHVAGANDTIVNLGGLTMMPGMIQGHFHAVYDKVGNPDNNPSSLNGGLDPNNSSSAVSYIALRNVQTALKCGFTTLVGAGTRYDIDPMLAHAIESEVVHGPRFVPASRLFKVSDEQFDTPEALFCRGPKSFAKAAELEISRGAKIIKLMASGGHFSPYGPEGDMTADEVRAVVEVARSHGVRTRAHVARRDMNLLCARAGVEIIDHADGLDDECIEAFLKHDCFVIPSLYLPYICKMRSGDGTYGNDYDLAEYLHMRNVFPKVVESGLKLVIGVDFGVYDLPHGTYAGEMSYYVDEIGISPLEVIKWSTRNGGALSGIPDLGTIDAGKLADFIILDGDPSIDISVLADPKRIVAVIKSGKVVSGQLPPSPIGAELAAC